MAVVHTVAGATAICVPFGSLSAGTHAVIVVIGGGLALILHIGRAAIRLLSTATTGGVANCVISLIEDAIVFILCPMVLLIAAMAVITALLVVLAIPGTVYARHKQQQQSREREYQNVEVAVAASQPGGQTVLVVQHAPGPVHQLHPAQQVVYAGTFPQSVHPQQYRQQAPTVNYVQPPPPQATTVYQQAPIGAPSAPVPSPVGNTPPLPPPPYSKTGGSGYA